MQNTDTNPSSGASSALTEPKTGTVSLLKITINHEPEAPQVSTHKRSVLRRVLSLCAKMLPFSRRRPQRHPAAAIPSVSLQQTSVTLQEKQHNTTPVNIPPHLPSEPRALPTSTSLLHRMAEQQFREMDVSLATRN